MPLLTSDAEEEAVCRSSARGPPPKIFSAEVFMSYSTRLNSNVRLSVS